jgi:hypothetical protein
MGWTRFVLPGFRKRSHAHGTIGYGEGPGSLPGLLGIRAASAKPQERDNSMLYASPPVLGLQRLRPDSPKSAALIR